MWLLQVVTAARRRCVTFSDSATRLIQSYFVASRQLRSTDDAAERSMPINAVDILCVLQRRTYILSFICPVNCHNFAKECLVVPLFLKDEFVGDLA